MCVVRDFCGCVCWLLPWLAAPLLAQQPALPELRTAQDIRQLSAEQASRHYPVHLKGVVTFFDPGQFYRFIQDDTAGIYFYLDGAIDSPPLAAGQLIEMEGETNPGEYAPIVMPHRVRVLGEGKFPPAKQVSFEQVASGQEDSQFLEIKGIVRAVRRDEQSRYYFVEIATGGGRLTALSTELPVPRSQDLVDSIVRIKGVCSTQFNRQRQLFDLRLLVPQPADLVIETPALSDPFSIPAQSITRLLQFTPQEAYGHRVKVSGTVIYHRPDDATLFIQDEAEARSRRLHAHDAGCRLSKNDFRAIAQS
jgi:hypothetical protein